MITDMHTAIAERAVGAYRMHLAALGRSPHTITTRCDYPTRLFADLRLPPAAVTTADIEAWLAAHTWGQQTRRIAIISLRQFYAWAEGAGVVEVSPAAPITPPRQPSYTAHPIPDDVLAAAMTRASGDTWWILRLLATTGLRRSEAANLTGTQLQGRWLRIIGKGGKVRRVPPPDDVAAFVASRPGRVFTATGGGPLLPTALANRVRHATGGYGPHTLRHRYATRIYAATGDVLAVQQLLGHASLATTQTYLGLSEDRLIAAAAAAA